MELSEQISNAAYGKLNIQAVTDEASGGVFTDDTYFDNTEPFVVIKVVDGIPIDDTFGFTRGTMEFLIHITAFADRENASPLSPQSKINAILALCDTTLGQVLALEKGTCEAVKFSMDLPFLKIQQSDRNNYSRTKRYRVWVNNNPHYLALNNNVLTLNGNILAL